MKARGVFEGWAHHQRTETLRAVIRKTLDEGKRVYEGSVDAQVRRLWDQWQGTPSTEAGDPLLTPESSAKSSLRLWKSLQEFAMEPLLSQFSNGAYGWSHLSLDLLASLTNAFLLIPGGIAYGFLARVPSVVALTGCILPPAVYALFGNSRQLSIGPDALVSIMTGLVVEREVSLNGLTAVQVASTLALLTGLFCIILSILRAGFIDNIISGFLLTGFVTGIAILILAEQLPALLGIPISVSGNIPTYEKLRRTFTNFDKIHPPTCAVGLASLAFLYAVSALFKFLRNKGYDWLQRIPIVVLLMILSIFVSGFGDLAALGIPVLGPFEHALAPPSAPILTTEIMSRLFVDAVMLILTGFIEMQSVTRMYSIKNDYYVSGDRELFAIGAANVVASFFGSYTVFGSLPRSRIMDLSGSKTTLVNLFSAIWVLIALYALHSVIRYIPKATLAAIIFKAASALIEFGDIKFIFKLHAWTDLAMFFSTFLITFTSNISNGIILCLIFAILIIIRKISAADLSIMGKVDNRSYKRLDSFENENKNPILYLDIKEHPEAKVMQGILILSIRGPLVFYNCGSLPRTIEVLTKTDMELVKRQISAVGRKEDTIIPIGRLTRPHTLTASEDSNISDFREAPFEHSRKVQIKCLQSQSLDRVSASLQSSLSGGRSKNVQRKRHIRSQSEPCSIHRTLWENAVLNFEPDCHPYVIILDFGRCSDLDSSAMLILEQLITSYKHKKTTFLLSGLHPFHRRIFGKAGMIQTIGEDNVFDTIEKAITSVKQHRLN